MRFYFEHFHFTRVGCSQLNFPERAVRVHIYIYNIYINCSGLNSFILEMASSQVFDASNFTCWWYWCLVDFQIFQLLMYFYFIFSFYCLKIWFYKFNKPNLSVLRSVRGRLWIEIDKFILSMKGCKPKDIMQVLNSPKLIRFY